LAWNFSLPSEQRRGIFIGTREFGVPSRNHLLAITSVLDLGHSVTVINTEGWIGARLLRSISREVRVISGRLAYRDYLGLMARHRIVFQLDRTSVPGQVAGDSILCGLPCLGGDGAIDRLAFPDFCGPSLTVESVLQVAKELLANENYYLESVQRSRELALRHFSFSAVKAQLISEFAA
jgi:hypothetical protein